MIYKGADSIYSLAAKGVEDAAEKHGGKQQASYSSTAFGLPVCYALSGEKATCVDSLRSLLEFEKGLITHRPALEDALRAGLSAIAGAEILESLKWIEEGGPNAPKTRAGFLSDSAVRSLCVPLSTGNIPAIAALAGMAPSSADASRVVKEYQSKGILCFLSGKLGGQLAAEGVKMGMECRIAHAGSEISPLVHFFSVVLRIALIFGKVKPGDFDGCIKYAKEHVPAFMNSFGPIDEGTAPTIAAAVAMGFPAVVDSDLGESQIHTALEFVSELSALTERTLALRGVKGSGPKASLPVSFSASFEQESVRRSETQTEFSSEMGPVFELLLLRADKAVEDHSISVVGMDLDAESPPTSLAILIEVSGKGMHRDYEEFLQKRVPAWIGRLEGVMHSGSSYSARMRVSKAAYDKGLRLKDIGEAIWAMARQEFGSLVEACQVTLITDAAKAREIMERVAVPIKEAREARLAALTDEGADAFYLCTQCQALALGQLCVVTPERAGICGGVTWLSCKAACESSAPYCLPVTPAPVVDEAAGRFEGVDKAVSDWTSGAVQKVSLYSLMQGQLPSIGCFETVAVPEPAAGGVVIVSRAYQGESPSGTSFAELAALADQSNEGSNVAGFSRDFIASKKFLKAEGGLRRIVWMPKELKNALGSRLNAAARDLYGIEGFTDMIADETSASEKAALAKFLAQQGHPAASMDPMQ
jgi:acetyl-CoA synthase